MRFTLKRKLAVAGVATAVILGSSVAAFAYFSSSGSGNGNATVGSSTAFTVTQTSTTGTIYPGSGGSTITYSVKNVGGGDEAVSNVSSSIMTSGSDAATSAGADIPGCLAAWFTVSDSGHAAYTTLAAGATETGTVVVSMPSNPAKQNACQGTAPGVTTAVS